MTDVNSVVREAVSEFMEKNHTAIRFKHRCIGVLALTTAVVVGIGGYEFTQIPRLINLRLDKIQTDVLQQFNTSAIRLDTRLGQTVGVLKDAVSGLNTTEQSLTTTVAQVASDTNSQLTVLNSGVTTTEATLTGVVPQVNDLLTDYTIPHREVEGLVAQTLGLLAASKVTAGQMAKTSIAIQDAIPDTVAQFHAIGENLNLASLQAAEASKQSAITMRNIAAATKPLPTWARVVFGVAVPAAETGASVAALGSALGWFRK